MSKSHPITRPIVLTGERPNVLTMPVQATIFRPRGILALTVILLPIMFSLIVIMIVHIAALSQDISINFYGASIGIVVSWLVGVLITSRVFLMTVYSTSDELIIVTPWGERRSIRWQVIDRVEWRTGFLLVRSSDGKQMAIFERGLNNGEQLLRNVLLRVSPMVLSQPLQYELDLLSGKGLDERSGRLVPEITIAFQWFLLSSVIALGGTGLATWGTLIRQTPLLIVGALLGFLGVLLLLLLRQTIVLTETGITIRNTGHSPQTFLWNEITLVEMTLLGMRMAITGNRRVTFLGPFFMSPLRRTLLHNALSDRVLSRGVPEFRRRIF
jgi:hypothetical protein